MKILCPKCKLAISSIDTNIAENICFCKNCNETYYISNILNEDEHFEIDKMLNDPPKGTWNIKNYDEMLIGVSTFSKESISVLIFNILFSGFIYFCIFDILFRHKAILASLFMIPFVLASLYLMKETLFAFFGKIEIHFCKDTYIFIGVGKIGKKHFIKWDSLKGIWKSVTRESEGGIKKEIFIEEKRIITIPLKYITDNKGKYLFYALKYYMNNNIEEIIK